MGIYQGVVHVFFLSHFKGQFLSQASVAVDLLALEEPAPSGLALAAIITMICSS